MPDSGPIVGRYRLVKQIGEGGMGDVFLAEQSGPLGFRRLAVLKRLNAKGAEQEGAVEGFADEARLAARLQHPNIVRTEDFFEEDGNLYMVLEYVQGRNLNELTRLAHMIDQNVPLEMVLQAGVDIAEALEFVHTLHDGRGQPLSIVHRDISPHNIMVTPGGQAKLLDFGVASSRANRVKTDAKTVRGKVHYFSPEQAFGSGVDSRSDQFSLAIVLFEALTRTWLFADA